MILKNHASVGTRYQTDNCKGGVQYYDLSNRNECPVLKFLKPINRRLKDKSQWAYKDLERSIRTYGCVFQPILVSVDGYILDGQHRWEIANYLWSLGIDVKISIIVTPFVRSTDDNIRNVIIDLQKGHAWTPEDKLNSLAATGNKVADFILKMANKPVSFTSKKKLGVRNSLVVCGEGQQSFNNDDFGETMTQEYTTIAQKIFDEVNTLLTIGVKENDSANNWTEAFIKAWRRIRTNDPSLKKENEEGEKTIVDTQALNNMVDSIGLVELGLKWRAYANKSFSNGRIGSWVEMFERAIVETYEYIQKYGHSQKYYEY